MNAPAPAFVQPSLAKAYAPVFYAITVVLLLLVRSPLGSSSRGAQRWFQVSGFQLSPSYFARLGLILLVAAYLSERKREITFGNVLACTLMAGCRQTLTAATGQLRVAGGWMQSPRVDAVRPTRAVWPTARPRARSDRPLESAAV